MNTYALGTGGTRTTRRQLTNTAGDSLRGKKDRDRAGPALWCRGIIPTHRVSRGIVAPASRRGDARFSTAGRLPDALSRCQCVQKPAGGATAAPRHQLELSLPQTAVRGGHVRAARLTMPGATMGGGLFSSPFMRHLVLPRSVNGHSGFARSVKARPTDNPATVGAYSCRALFQEEIRQVIRAKPMVLRALSKVANQAWWWSSDRMAAPLTGNSWLGCGGLIYVVGAREPLIRQREER